MNGKCFFLSPPAPETSALPALGSAPALLAMAISTGFPFWSAGAAATEGSSLAEALFKPALSLRPRLKRGEVGDSGVFGEFDERGARRVREELAPEAALVSATGGALRSVCGEEEVGEGADCESASFCFLGGIRGLDKHTLRHQTSHLNSTKAEALAFCHPATLVRCSLSLKNPCSSVVF